MSKVPCWPEETLAELRRLREAGKSWPEIGEALQVCPDAARRQGYKMKLAPVWGKRRAGPLPRQPRAATPTDAVQKTPAQLVGARPTLPPGATWALLTAGTCLDGQPYPETVARLA